MGKWQTKDFIESGQFDQVNPKEMKDYLESHPDLPEDKKAQIRRKIAQGIENNRLFFQRMAKAKVTRYGMLQLIREGKGEIYEVGQFKKITVDPIKAFLRGVDVQKEAEKKGIELIEYREPEEINND